jgi:hypothetical protein
MVAAKKMQSTGVKWRSENEEKGGEVWQTFW